MVLLGVSMTLAAVAVLTVLVALVRRRRARRRSADVVTVSAVPEELLQAERAVTRRLLTGGIVRSEFRHAMAELARQGSDYPGVR